MNSRALALMPLYIAIGLLACSTAFAVPFVKPKPKAAHVVLVIEENRSFQTLIGSKDAPYINQLASQGALFTQSFGVTHPSEPNYLALFAGDTFGLADDSCPHDFTGPNLAEALEAKGLSFSLYSESLPQTGFADCGTLDKLYRRKHNPVPNFKSVPNTVNQPFSEFPTDYSKLPTVAYVVPNMMNDMHDGTVQQGDAWLKQNLDGYVQWALKNHSMLIITWDEDDGTQNNQIPTIIIGQGVKPGKYNQKIDHYSVLRTLLDMNKLKAFGNAKKAKPIAGAWTKN